MVGDGRLNWWIVRLAFAMVDSSHVDDEREGRLSGPSGREHFRKGNKSSGTWPRHADENEFGVRPAAADCTAPRKACLATLTLRQRERLAAQPAHLTLARLWLIPIVAATQPLCVISLSLIPPRHIRCLWPPSSPLSAYPSPRAALYVAHATSI
jgi:hypothetical protein